MSQPTPYRTPDARDTRPIPSAVREAALFAAWTFGGIVLIGITRGVLSALGTPLASALSPVGAVIIAASLLHLLQTFRRRRAMQILSYIEQAVRLNLPLPRMLRAAEASERGVTRKRLMAVREMLEFGGTLGNALDRDVPEVPQRLVQLIAAAEKLGRLGPMLRSVLQQEQRVRSGDATRAVYTAAYPLAILLVLAGVAWMVCVFVLPKYQEILRDFGVAPTWPMRWLVAAWLWLPPALVVSVIALLWYLGLRLWEIFMPASRARGPHRLLDWLAWHTPLVGGMVRDRGLADVCRVVADGMRNGFPLDRAVLEAGDLRVNSTLKGRIHQWMLGLVSGLPPAEAARQARLPALVSGMLSAGGADPAAAMDFLAGYYNGRFSRTLMLLHGAMIPGMALVFGAFVALVALAIFTPMIDLVNTINLSWGSP